MSKAKRMSKKDIGNYYVYDVNVVGSFCFRCYCKCSKRYNY